MAKKTYAGVLSDVPIYEITSRQVEFNMTNFQDTFFSRTIESGSSSYLNIQWNSTNNAVSINPKGSGSTVVVTYTALHDLTGVIVGHRSIKSTTYLSIRINGVSQSLTNSMQITWIQVGNLSKGGTIKLSMTYPSSSSYTPYVFIACDNLNIEEKTLTGYEQKDAAQQITRMYCSPSGVAREVKKVYVGDENGIARQMFASS